MKQMSSIVRTIADMTYIFILIFGLYIILHGHLTPGGGFQGGAVIASAFALIIVAYGTEQASKIYNKDIFSLGESGGLLAFLGVAFFGITTAFFYNQLEGGDGFFGEAVAYGVNSGNLNSAGTIPLMNVAVGLEVLSGFGVILLSMIYFMKARCGEEGGPADCEEPQGEVE